LFIEWGLGNFLRNLKQKFKNYKFFTCSALGRVPDDSGNPFSPQRVTEPFMWILEKKL
jgi:hypothetical protein